jgi:hypothetical protein
MSLVEWNMSGWFCFCHVQVRWNVMLKIYKYYGYSMEQHGLSFYSVKLLSHSLCDDSLDHCGGKILTLTFRKPYTACRNLILLCIRSELRALTLLRIYRISAKCITTEVKTQN